MTDVISDVGEIYAETRRRITALVHGADPNRVVPATPSWTVRDVVAHMAGNVASIVEGRLEGVGSDAWTAAQLAEREGRTIHEVLAEWNEKAPQVEAMVHAAPPVMARMLIADVATHEQDLRGALGVPGARDSRAFAIAFDGFSDGIGARLAQTAIGALAIRTSEGEKVVGEGDPAARVAAGRFELTRAMAGRRSARQVRAFEWEGDPTPYVEVFTPFSLRAEDLVE